MPFKKQLGHPFDETERFESYLIDPLGTEFRPWDLYKVNVSFEGHEYTEDCAVHYYSYWQIHQLYAIRTNNSLRVLLNLQDPEIQQQVWHRKIPIDKMHWMKIPARRQVARGDFLGVNRWLDGLSMYVQRRLREKHITFHYEAVEEGHRRVLTGEPLRSYQKRCKQHAQTVVQLCQFSLDELYSFLKVLASLFFDYQDAGRTRLAEELSEDIWHLVELISFLEDKTFEEISRKVGRLSGHRKNALDVIFPNEIEDAKEDTLRTLDHRSQKYNQEMTRQEYHLDKADLEAFIAFLEQHDLSVFFQTITGLNRDWFKHTAFSANNLLIHLRNLSILVESVVKEIGRNSKCSAMRQEFLNAPKYGNDDDFADNWAKRFLLGMNETINQFKDAWGYTWTMDGSTATGYTMMGLAAGASPDGRLACTSLADGSLSPMAGTDSKGPTAVLNSAAKLPFLHTELFNQRFMPTFLEGANKELFAAYLKTWYEKGTIPHIQFNVVDSEELRDAKVKPEDHSELIVRVAGYSAHFVDLPDHSQDSIIERTVQAIT